MFQNPGISTAGLGGEATELTLRSVSGFNIPAYDFIKLGYLGGNLISVSYYIGGQGGTLVATLTLTYDGSNNLQTVTKS